MKREIDKENREKQTDKQRLKKKNRSWFNENENYEDGIKRQNL